MSDSAITAERIAALKLHAMSPFRDMVSLSHSEVLFFMDRFDELQLWRTESLAAREMLEDAKVIHEKTVSAYRVQKYNAARKATDEGLK